MFFIPAYLVLGAVLGATVGCFAAFAFALTLPNESVQPGPDGSPVTVLHDYTAVPIVGGLGGFALGLAGGGLVAARKVAAPTRPVGPSASVGLSRRP
jgi:hypothetical protein